LAKLPGVGYPKILNYTTTLSAALRPGSGLTVPKSTIAWAFSRCRVFCCKREKMKPETTSIFAFAYDFL